MTIEILPIRQAVKVIAILFQKNFKKIESIILLLSR